MRIAKPLLLTTTPIGVVWGIFEACRIRWWLGLLMGVLVGVIAAFSLLTVNRIRHDARSAAQFPH